MSVHFSVENINFNLKEKLRIKKWISEVVKTNGKKLGDVCYLFCDDSHLHEVNISYLNHDTLTDIITFDYDEGDIVSGDILISIDRVRENAQIFNVSFEQELHRVIIHGILHLLGQGDKTAREAKRMRARENEALELWNNL